MSLSARTKFYEHDGKAYCERCILVVNPQTNVRGVVRSDGRYCALSVIRCIIVARSCSGHTWYPCWLLFFAPFFVLVTYVAG